MSDANDAPTDCKMIDIRNNLITVCKDLCATTCVKSAAINSTNWVYAAGYFQGPIIYPVNTSSCICVNTGCSSNWALAMVFKPEGCVHTNTTNNWGGLRSGNLSLGYGASYNTLCNVASGQQLHLRTHDSANIKIGDSGTTCTFICNCVQSPIVCATNCVSAVQFCSLDGWYRSRGATGLYNSTRDAHFYAASDNYWHINPKAGQTTGALIFYQSHNSAGGSATGRRGYVYFDGTNNFGLLSCGGSWAVKIGGDSLLHLCKPTCIPTNLTVSGADDYHGIVIGQAYSNNGSWDTQLNMYGTDHVMARWCKSAGDAADNARYGCIWIHNNNPFTIVSSGNMRLCAAGTVKLCLTSALTCVHGCLGIASITNQARTESTKFFASSDNFIRYHDRCHFKGLLGLTSRYPCSRTQITSDSNYWMGSMGWAAQCFNCVGRWGSGFFDVWSNPGQQPSGTSHWVGTQAMHYSSNETTTYGWQMAVGAGSPALTFMRGNWGSGWSSWYKMWNAANLTDPVNQGRATICASSLVCSPISCHSTCVYATQFCGSGRGIKNIWFGGGSDFADGTLVTTDIPSSSTNGESYVIEVSGKSYNSSRPPFKFMAQGYLYNDTIIAYSGVNISGHRDLTYMKAMNCNGCLAFWWPRISYWNSFSARVCASNSGCNTENRVTNVYNSVDPSGATKKVTICFQRSYTSDNLVNGNQLEFGNTVGSGQTTIGLKTSPTICTPYLCGTTHIHADADSRLTIANVGTNAIGIYGCSGDEVYIGSNAGAGGAVRFPSAGGIDASTGVVKGPIVCGSTCVHAGTVCSTQIYSGNWFRNNTSGTGLYNQTTAQHFYSDDTRYWNIGGGCGEQGLRFRDTHAAAIRGGLYADTNNNFGFKDSAGYWTYRTQRNASQEWKISDTTYLCLSTTCLCSANIICAGSCFKSPHAAISYVCATTCVETANVNNLINLCFTSGNDSGLGTSVRHYGIYRGGGAWSHPYPDLVINYHTGIRYGAHKSYHGHRFFSSTTASSAACGSGTGGLLFSIGRGDDHTRVHCGNFYSCNMICAPIACATTYLYGNHVCGGLFCAATCIQSAGVIVAGNNIVSDTNNNDCLGVIDKYWKCAYLYHVSSSTVCAATVCATTGFYGDGSNITGISAGYDPLLNTLCHNGGTDCRNVIFGKCAAERARVTSGDINNSVIIGRCTGYYACGGTHTFVGIGAGRGYFCDSCNHLTYMNTMIGYDSGSNGHCKNSGCKFCKNTFIGASSGGGQPHYGSENTVIGATAGDNMQGAACGNTYIGFYAGYNCTTASNQLVMGSYKTSSGVAAICYGCIKLCGAVYKASGSFLITHPNPEKRDTTDLFHSFVESPTAGDNIYRWQVDVQNCCNVITLPDYYRFLNEDDMVWVSPYKNFGSAYGEVTEDQKCLIVCSNQDGKYNVLLIGTRKDECATTSWKGTERGISDLSPDMEDVFEWGEEDENGNRSILSQERHRSPAGPDYNDW